MPHKEVFLETDNFILRPLKIEDTEGNYANWLNDPEIVKFNSHGRFPQTIATLKNYIESTQISQNQIILAIIDKNSNNHIGNISLQSINWVDRNAEIAFLLGEKKFWGQNVMTEVGIIIIQHAFSTLGLHRLYCGTASNNIGMQKLALKLNMKQEGTRKEAIFNKGIFYDIIEYGLINKNYN